jgi:hypothetical protein
LWSSLFALLTTCFSGDQIKEDEMGVACGTYVGKEECIQGFLGKSKEKNPLARPRHRLEDNIKVYLKERGWMIID